jgi:hypothetical protein
VLAKALADNIKSTCERGIAEGSAPSRENGERIEATKDISGLVSSPWAAAMVPIDSLERAQVMGCLHPITKFVLRVAK